uniref:NADH-ubiquinone oxidoreductase chain 2 n=1 Tax=Amphiura sinicola TaxID=2705302 RepID=A0A6C0FGZ5_9ECHI|nr:NADH dehydrogenase subunit 2 [Amphiura sinicola]QHT54219.1 NADH dehydrogenase subunit 2 [Amphiura sinicola]
MSLVMSVLTAFFSNSWILVWALIELVTVILVSLISTSFTPRTVESVAKYYIINAVASIILLSGILIRYFVSGSLLIFSSYSGISYFLIILGLLIKIAVFPNPFWFIEVISGIGLLRGFYVLIISKIIPLYLFINLVLPNEIFLWGSGLSAVLLGSIYGLNQTNIRKLIALSSVAHLGWLIVGLPNLSLLECLLIILIYLIMIFPLLWVVGLFEVEDLKSISQCYFGPPFLLIIVISLLSLGGFPPTLGFIYKLYIFIGLVNEGAFLVSLILIIMSVVSLVFYMRLCFLLYSVYWPEQKLLVTGSYISIVENTWFIWWLITGFSVLLSTSVILIGLV